MGMVRMKFTSEDAQAVRSFMKLENRQKSLAQKQKRVGKQSKKTSKTAAGGLRKWAGRTASVIAGYMGVTTAISKATSAMRDMQQARKEGARELDKGFQGMGSLAQLAEDRRDMEWMMQEVRRTQSTTGMGVDQASELQFQLQSAGMEDQRALFAGLFGMADPSKMVSSVKRMQGSLGRDETGSAKELLDKMFIASGTAQATVSEIATGSVKAGKSTGAIGTTDEELLAAMAVGSSGQASVDETATRFRAFGKQIDKAGRGGQGMMSAMREIQEEVEAGADIYDILKSQRAVDGYRILRDQAEEISGLTGKIDKAGKEAAQTAGPVGERTRRAMALRDMAVGDVQRKKRAEQQQKIAKAETYGKPQTQREAILESMETYRTGQINRGEASQFGSGVKAWMSGEGFQSYLGYSPEHMIRSIEDDYGMEAAAAAAKNAGLIYKPGSQYHLKHVASMPMSGQVGSDEIWSRFSTPGLVTSGQGNRRQPQRPIDRVDVQSDVPGTSVEHNVNIKNKQSNQRSRTGGAAGVE